MVVLDTSFLIDLLRRRPEATALLVALERDEVPCRTTVMNVLELYRGAWLSSVPERNRRECVELIASIEVLTISDRTFDIYGACCRELAAQGRQIGGYDGVIAALALEYDGSIVTRDEHFRRIPGLQIVEY
jgi:predicted nucleic acid-binding protein